ncbi:hypothetical protein BC332_03303 [Capsicum chinense]|nr:hypothetical protein BC332_03303 [Capsicum chinense]
MTRTVVIIKFDNNWICDIAPIARLVSDENKDRARNCKVSDPNPSTPIRQGTKLTTQSSQRTKHTNFSDYAALLAFKSSLRMEPHNILSTNWSSDTHFCSWYGVSCLHQRVVALQLPNLSIQGRIASDIANLTKLAVLDLSSNDLNGNLPSELGFLQLLRLLNVTRNSLDGTIPPNISRCHLLQEFHLSDNMNKGSIPQELGLKPTQTFASQ